MSKDWISWGGRGLFCCRSHRAVVHRRLGEVLVPHSAEACGHFAGIGVRAVWSTLHLLMGTAAWLVWRQRRAANVTLALALFFAQLALNATWSFVFFGLRQLGLALLEILALLAAIVATMTNFVQLSRLAFWLMAPYAAWVLYATFLNFGIWRLNRGAP